MKLEDLKGKSILEVIVALPQFKWQLNEPKICTVKPKLNRLIFVYYEHKKPRENIDLYLQLGLSKGISLDDLAFITEKGGGVNIGFTSKVELGKPYSQEEHKFAHIPMIDLDTDRDFSFMSDKDLQDLIKRKIRETTEIERGVLLRSGPKRNYHFIGIGKLLSEEEFITFLGLALTMKYKTQDRDINLADPIQVGHALTPMKYLAQLSKLEDSVIKHSAYDYRDRFSTLRITPKPSYKDFPRVVDVLK